MTLEDSASSPKGAAKVRQGAGPQLSYLSFDKLLPVDRAKLIRSFSDQEDLAREFWEDIGSEIELAQMLGCGWDLKMTRSGSTGSDVKARMEVVYNSCRRLLTALDGACLKFCV